MKRLERETQSRNQVTSLRLGITGSPGTGKKSVAKELSKLTGLEIISLNDIVLKKRLGRKVKGEFVVDMRRLQAQRIDTRGKIIVGHLLPYVIPRKNLDFVAILRCPPHVLRRRYLKRRYSDRKIEENIEAEVLDIVSYAALITYGKRKVAEFGITRSKTPKALANRILSTIQGKRPKQYGIAAWSKAASKSASSLLRIMRS